MVDENNETEIYSDWYIVKQNIWLNWFNLINLSKQLVEYKLKGVNPKQSRSFNSCCSALYQVYRSIGKSKYSKFLKPTQVTIIEDLIKKITKGNQPDLTEIQAFMDLTDDWLEASGMGKIDKSKDNPGQAMLENGYKK